MYKLFSNKMIICLTYSPKAIGFPGFLLKRAFILKAWKRTNNPEDPVNPVQIALI
jgi:hypothetical protein